jgi:tetratricopeptide (TPR) repeat protein
MKQILTASVFLFLIVYVTGCENRKDVRQLQVDIRDMNLATGDVALCGSGEFGEVKFALSCEENVRADFNLATSLLHSFEYVEAEKVFARVMERDPECIMAYWGAAMSNFHPLWAAPTKEEIAKGAKIVSLARTVEQADEREKEYVEAIATIFDDADKLDHKSRLQKFVTATEAMYKKYPDDKEAAIFYALALRASAEPTDKTFVKQRRAGEILNGLFPNEPNHPGVAHYLIHTYDYPELAELALPAARKYAVIASTSAHAQHMPSHIFTRLGLWDESIESNIKSTDAARCYAEKLGEKGHWEQELHGVDYLVYAYLQQGRDKEAKELVDYIGTIDDVFPKSVTGSYTFAAAPVRYAIERKDWKQAASLKLHPADFPWDKLMWQKGIHHFGRFLGAINIGDIKSAETDLEQLRSLQASLVEDKKDYEANQLKIQITAAEGWMHYKKGRSDDALKSMIAAADMEDATEKAPVTPGEVAPARELLGDMYLSMGKYSEALAAYTANLKKRPNRFNSVYGAAVSAKKSGNNDEATRYFKQLIEIGKASDQSRPQLKEAKAFLQPV